MTFFRVARRSFRLAGEFPFVARRRPACACCFPGGHRRRRVKTSRLKRMKIHLRRARGNGTRKHRCSRAPICVFLKLMRPTPRWCLFIMAYLLTTTSCAPRIVNMHPVQGMPGTTVSLSVENLVGWPRVEIGGQVMDWPQLKLLASNPERQTVRGEDLVWNEDKILQFRVPALPPGDYTVIIHDDKGPPGQPVYAFLETTAYVLFPPVWPYLFRNNRAQANFKILPRPASAANGS